VAAGTKRGWRHGIPGSLLDADGHPASTHRGDRDAYRSASRLAPRRRGRPGAAPARPGARGLRLHRDRPGRAGRRGRCGPRLTAEPTATDSTGPTSTDQPTDDSTDEPTSTSTDEPTDPSTSGPTGSSADREAIAGIAEAFYHGVAVKDGPRVCALLTAAAQRAAGDGKDCATSLQEADLSDDEVTALSRVKVNRELVQVTGDRAEVPASATSVDGSTTTDTGDMKLVRQGGTWKIDDIA
jgi:hypothetical protein